ncbi:hypothetical protein Tco_0914942 [Tanacetum coccineum]
MLQCVKSYLGRCFAMKDLGKAAYILGIKIYRDRSRWLIGLCQSAYIEKILKWYHRENSKHGSIPMQEKLRLSKSQAASTPAELKHMQNVPYASANLGDHHWTTDKNIRSIFGNTKYMFLVKEESKMRAHGFLLHECRISNDAETPQVSERYVFVLMEVVPKIKSWHAKSISLLSSQKLSYMLPLMLQRSRMG